MRRRKRKVWSRRGLAAGLAWVLAMSGGLCAAEWDAAEAVAEAATEREVEVEAEAATENRGDLPTEMSAESVTEPVAKEGAEVSTEAAEPVAEAPTEAAAEEELTEVSTEPVTEAPTEPLTEPVAEEPTEPPTEPVAEEPTEPPTEPVAEEPMEAPTELVAEEPTEAPTEPVVEEAPTEAPTEPVVEEAPIEAPAEPVVEEVSTEALTEPVAEELTTEAPTEPASEEPTETPTESWTEEPTTEALTEPVTEEPTEPPTEAVSEPFTESISEGSSESQDNTDQLSSEKKDLSITLAVVSELGQNQLKIEEDSQDFAEALFSEEERMRGGHGTVRISADSAEELLKEEAEKSDDQKLTQEERSAIEAEQEVLTQWIAENGYTAGQSFVLRLKKGLDGEGWTRVYESAESLRMILELSDVPAEAEEAILIFVQNGQIIICTDLDTAISRISFEGRTFGTYAVAYRLCQEDSQTENGAAIERESETKDEGASGQEAESESELQSESESEAGTEPELPSEPEPESETEPEILNESETESETELEPELEPESTCAEIEISVSAEAVVYQPGTTGTWNPHTHCYEGGTAGGWIYADGSNEVLLTNHSEQDVTLILSYQSLQEYGEITGSFTDLNGEEICEVTIPAGEAVTVLVVLDGKPDTALLSESIGEITYEQIEEEA